MAVLLSILGKSAPDQHATCTQAPHLASLPLSVFPRSVKAIK